MKSFELTINQHIQSIQLAATCKPAIELAANLLIDTFKNNKKVLLCGNGGSAADAQHLAAEFMVRYKLNRQPLPAIALTTDTSVLTACANDYDYSNIFARQIAALGNPGDTLIAISTTGNSDNIVQAAHLAQLKDMNVIALTGNSGGELAMYSTHPIILPLDDTARIQEAHIMIGHYWCEMVEDAMMTI